MSTIISILKSPAIKAGVLALVLAGCAAKPKIPDNANGLGLNNNNNGVAVGTPQDFTVNVGDRVFFTTDSTSLTPEGQQTLNGQAAWLIRYPNYPITLEGHADERGTREYNIALGARRAAAARDYLVSRGVPRSRIRTISFGKERPVAVCNDISCWSQNRRAVTLLTAPTG
ncbi:MAG: peptidoglycan-associated lipoprotein Pal [Nitratireductor sp.]